MNIAIKILSQVPKFLGTIVLELIGCIIVSIYFCYRKSRGIPYDTKFPKCISWFDNYSNQYGPDPSSYWEVFNWLCLRNPLNVFQYTVLGFVWKDDAIIVHFDEKPSPHAGTTESTSGSWYSEVIVDGKTYWELFVVKKWPGLNKVFRFRCGWKIGRLETNSHGEVVQWCFTPTLFKEIGT